MPALSLYTVALARPSALPLSSRGQVLQSISQPHYRNLAAALLDDWHNHAPELSPEALAVALVVASAERHERQEQSIELTWTGPDVQAIPVRRTEQVLLQVIHAARTRLTVTSYAVYRIPRIVEALVQAATRGVDLRIIVETPDRIAGQGA